MNSHFKKDPAHSDASTPNPDSKVSPDKENFTQESKDGVTAECERLQKRVEELEGLREKFLHAAADFENAKKRNAREKEEFIKFSQERILRDMLPVLDNFERAVAHTSTAELSESNEEKLRANFKNMAAGVQMVQKQFTDTLKKYGLSRLKAVGEKFDPNCHEAVAHVAGDGDEDVIVDEIEAGYMIHDRLLRAAKVRVRIAPPQGKQDEIT